MKASMTSILISSIIVLILHAKIAHCCGGYELVVDYIRNCDSNNIIELSDKFSIVLKPNCEVHFNGCIISHANITSIIIDYTVQKDLTKMSSKKDGCKQLENIIKSSSYIETSLNALGLPKRCPINEGTVCLGIKSINVSKYKFLMNALAGHLKGKSLITTNAGKSCVEFSVKLVNAFVKAERAKSKIGRWVDETMKGKFDNFVGSRKKSSSNTTTKINNDIPILPDADENIDADLLCSVKPAELHSRVTESVYEDETTRPPINLADIDLGLLFSNMTPKHHLENMDADERDVGRMIQRHLKLLNIGSENVGEDEH